MSLPALEREELTRVLKQEREDGHKFYIAQFFNENPPHGTYTEIVRDVLKDQPCEWKSLIGCKGVYIAHFATVTPAAEERIRVIQVLRERSRNTRTHILLSKAMLYDPEYLQAVADWPEPPQQQVENEERV